MILCFGAGFTSPQCQGSSFIGLTNQDSSIAFLQGYWKNSAKALKMSGTCLVLSERLLLSLLLVVVIRQLVQSEEAWTCFSGYMRLSFLLGWGWTSLYTDAIFPLWGSQPYPPPINKEGQRTPHPDQTVPAACHTSLCMSLVWAEHIHPICYFSHCSWVFRCLPTEANDPNTMTQCICFLGLP